MLSLYFHKEINYQMMLKERDMTSLYDKISTGNKCNLKQVKI